MTEPVVITGLGIVCSLGATRDEVADATRKGVRPFAPVQRFDASAFRVNLAAEAPALDIAERFGARFASRASRTDALAAWAVADALEQADVQPEVRRNASLYVGASSGGMAEMEAAQQAGDEPSARLFWNYPIWATAALLGSTFGIHGVRSTFMTACSSAAHALGLAMRRLRSGDEELVIAGGAESLCRLTLAGFGSLGVLDPSGARPFDAERQGITLGEGAAFFVMETASHAQRRGITPLAVLAGYGACAEAHHMVHPLEDGSGALTTMRAALHDAGLAAAEVDYVNAHGTGTLHNDAMEARAIACLAEGRPLRLASSKGMLGHTLGAAGALEAALVTLGMQHGFAPPNPGVSTPTGELGGLELLTEPTDQAPRHVLSSSFAFGGNDVALVISHAETLASGHRRAAPAPAPALVISGAALAAPCGTAAEPEALMALLDADAEGSTWQGLDPAAILGRGAIRRVDALSAAAMALASTVVERAGLETTDELAVAFGTSFGALDPAVTFLTRLFDKGPRLVNPLEFPNLVHNAPAGHIAIRLGARGPSVTTSQEELAGDDAVWASIDLLRAGDTKAALSAGGDMASDWLQRGYAAVDRLLATESRHASVLGVVLLEEANACAARGAQPWAQVLGVGAAGAYSGVAGAIGRALEDAKRGGLGPERIDLWYRGATERLGRENEELGRTLPLLTETVAVDARARLGDAGGCGPAVLAVAAASISLAHAQTVLVTSVTRDGGSRAFLLGALT